ncbi:hypothetical protein J6590_101907, partial [Homalodisca vitripennis]
MPEDVKDAVSDHVMSLIPLLPTGIVQISDRDFAENFLLVWTNRYSNPDSTLSTQPV